MQRLFKHVAEDHLASSAGSEATAASAAYTAPVQTRAGSAHLEVVNKREVTKGSSEEDEEEATTHSDGLFVAELCVFPDCRRTFPSFALLKQHVHQAHMSALARGSLVRQNMLPQQPAVHKWATSVHPRPPPTL